MMHFKSNENGFRQPLESPSACIMQKTSNLEFWDPLI